MKKLTAILGIPAIFALIFGTSMAAAQPGGGGGQPPSGGQQGGQPPAAGQQQQEDLPEIDEETKEKFLEAYADIIEIQNEYVGRLQNAESEDEAMELQQQAQEEMQTAVTENDLTVEEYNQVIQVASSDPELMAELEEAVGGEQGGAQGGQQ